MASADSAESEASLGELISKKNSSSVIWDYFGFEVTDPEQKRVICKSCRRIVATTRGNTTNLHQHLKKHHRRIFEECVAKKSTEIVASDTQSSSN